MLISRTIRLDDRGLRVLSKLHDISIVRKRYNRGVGRTWSRMWDARDIRVDAPPAPNTAGWTSLEDHLFFQGLNAKGREKIYHVMPFSEDNLNKMKEFLACTEKDNA